MANHVHIQYRNLSFDLCFQGKYTVLTGLSGAGKSLLVRTIEKLNRAFPGATYDGFPVYASVYSKALTDSILSGSGALIILDDDVDSEDRKAHFPAIETSDNYFIFITREPPDVPCDVYVLAGDRREHRMVPADHMPGVPVHGNG